MREQRWVFYFILLVYVVRVLLDFVVIPVFFKHLIDLFSSPIVDKSIVSEQAYKLFFIIAGLHVFVFCIARIIKFTYYRFLARVMRNLKDFAFKKISSNSYTFFSNMFSGSLVTKSRRFVFGFDGALEVFLFSFLQFAVIILGSLAV